MSIAGILSSALSSSSNSQNVPTAAGNFQQEFQQLGQDLQAGNLSAAQTDLGQLRQSADPIAQTLNQLSQDIKAGNTSAAQQDFATLQQDLRSQPAQTHHHHHHGGSGKAVSQLFDQLGQDLQSGDLTGAQQAYSKLQQTLPILQPAASGGAVSLVA